jgi:hypothetical protein
MAQVDAQIILRKCWFFWPAILTISALGKLGVLRDQQKAAQWLADNAMRIEVR